MLGIPLSTSLSYHILSSSKYLMRLIRSRKKQVTVETETFRKHLETFREHLGEHLGTLSIGTFRDVVSICDIYSHNVVQPSRLPS